MTSWTARWCACGALLLSAMIGGANPPTGSPQPPAAPTIPFGYYPTQWRPYPNTIANPEIRVILPKDVVARPDPKIVAPPLPPRIVEVKPEPAPSKKIVPHFEPNQPETAPEPRQQTILPADYIPDATPIFRQAAPPEIRVPSVEPQYLRMIPRGNAAEPAVKPQILNLLPDRDGFQRSDPFKNAAEEESDATRPGSDSKPKAWLEVPISPPQPVVRGSSHELMARPTAASIWRPLP